MQLSRSAIGEIEARERLYDEMAERKSTEEALTVAEKILNTLSQPFNINQQVISISASIGIATSPQHGDDVDLLLKNADAAMYGAKHAGRNAYRFFEVLMAFATAYPATP